eukprot:Seg2253.7 transcript_id=Seg2253.7/GoldUCD/mRNA.D3Y31 product="Cytochrome b561 DM13 and DOMON domain-containing protein" protein_id=Seg2253.7/GoldUCD/D3Y31
MAPYKYLSSAALLSLLFLIILSAQLAVSQNVLQWEKLNIVGSSPKARMDSVIGFDSSRNRVIVFGGRSSAEVFADTWILDISTRQWIKANDTLVNSLTIPGPRYGATFGTHKDRLIVAFGKGATKSAVSNEVYSFDYNSTTWSLVATNNANPSKRHFAAGGVTGDNLFATHGYDESSLKSDLYKLDLKSSRWEKLHDEVNQYSPVLPHARYLHGGAVLPGNKMLIFGGCLSAGKSSGPCPSSDTWFFKADTKKWQYLESCSSARVSSAVAVLPNSTSNSAVAVLFGGKLAGKQIITIRTEAKADEVFIFDTVDDKWKRRTVLKDPTNGLPELRSGHVMATTNQGVVMFGGVSSSNGNLLNDIWILKGGMQAARNSPNPGKCDGASLSFIALHSLFMIVSWGIMLQLGAFVARYFKHKGKMWYNTHRILAVLGLVFAIIGLSLGIVSTRGKHFSSAHGVIGLDVMLAGLYQPLNAIFRPAEPKEGEKKKLWRKIWEISHKFTGRTALLLGLINISLGMFLSLASKALWITWFAYLGIIIIAYVIAEIWIRKKSKKMKVGHENDVAM